MVHAASRRSSRVALIVVALVFGALAGVSAQAKATHVKARAAQTYSTWTCGNYAPHTRCRNWPGNVQAVGADGCVSVSNCSSLYGTGQGFTVCTNIADGNLNDIYGSSCALGYWVQSYSTTYGYPEVFQDSSVRQSLVGQAWYQ